MMVKTILSLLLFLAPVTISNADSIENKLRDAMASDIRTTEDISRDGNRKPIETLHFFGLKDDMRVMELLAGWGWYTKLLAPVLKENGKLYESLGTTRLSGLVKQSGFEDVEVLPVAANIKKQKNELLYSLSDFEFPIIDLDMVFTFRNYHNFNKQSRKIINGAVYKSLKSGGIYAVIDHTRRHMQDITYENNRRVDPVLVIKEIQSAGFQFEDYSILHYRPDDELRYEVGRKTIVGNTDRFTFKFRKP